MSSSKTEECAALTVLISDLQDISCLECTTTIGLKCLNTPQNYVLSE
jgi:hypothetical protein